jgi:hypothetical protein
MLACGSSVDTPEGHLEQDKPQYFPVVVPDLCIDPRLDAGKGRLKVCCMPLRANYVTSFSRNGK